MLRRACVVSAFVLVTMSAPAHAQTRSWLNQCMPGLFQACTSLFVTAEYRSTVATGLPFYPGGPGAPITEGYTRLTLGFQYLQGLDGLPDPGPWDFYRATLLGMNTTWTTDTDRDLVYLGHVPGEPTRVGGINAWINTNGPVTVFNGRAGTACETSCVQDNFPYAFANSDAGAFHSSNPQNTLGETYLTTYILPIDGFVGGCDVHAQSTLRQYATCGSTVHLTYDLPGRWSFTKDTRIAWEARGPATLGALRCTTGIDCESVTAVPEPSAYLLLLTGVLGVGLVGYRRREEVLTQS